MLKALCAKTASAATPAKGTDSPAESSCQDKKPIEPCVRAPFPTAPADGGSPFTRRQSSSPDRQPHVMQGIYGALSRPGFEFALLLWCKLRSVHAGKLVLPSKMKSSRCCSTSTAWPSCPLATSGTLEDQHDPSSLSYASQLTLGICLLPEHLRFLRYPPIHFHARNYGQQKSTKHLGICTLDEI